MPEELGSWDRSSSGDAPISKITKQSQTSDCPLCSDAVALVIAMEPAGSTPNARCLTIALASWRRATMPVHGRSISPEEM